MHRTQDTITEDVTDTIPITGTRQQHQNQTHPNSLQLHQHQSSQHSQVTTILRLQTKMMHTQATTEEDAGAGKNTILSFCFTNLEVI
jgi:hypothetical protein